MTRLEFRLGDIIYFTWAGTQPIWERSTAEYRSQKFPISDNDALSKAGDHDPHDKRSGSIRRWPRSFGLNPEGDLVYARYPKGSPREHS